jgi:hypothetical protein
MPMSPRLLRPRAASGFDPRRIANLALWLDFADLSSLAQNSDGTTAVAAASDPIGYIADKSGNARHFAQSINNNRPLLGSMNGRPAAAFDGSNDSLLGNAAALNIARNVGGFTAFVVKKSNATNVQMSFLNVLNGTSGLSRFNLGYSGGLRKAVGGRRLDGNPLSFVDVGMPNATTALVIFGGRLNYASGGASAIEGIVNGTFPAANSLTGTGNTSDTDSISVGIGASAGGTEQFFNGTMCEVLAFQRVLSDAEVQTLNTYLARKWGVV